MLAAIVRSNGVFGGGPHGFLNTLEDHFRIQPSDQVQEFMKARKARWYGHRTMDMADYELPAL
jgi:hypothetical protein